MPDLRSPSFAMEALQERNVDCMITLSLMSKIKFTYVQPDGDRIHYVNEDDVKVVLNRLPAETYQRLRCVIFNDRGWRRYRRWFGYVTAKRREIALCAQPPRISLGKAAYYMGSSPEQFGARPGKFWSRVAIRRFFLYEVFLHELGHLQEIRPLGKSNRLRFALETKAEEFAIYWRRKLWSQPFDHSDPAHNPPTAGSERDQTERADGIG